MLILRRGFTLFEVLVALAIIALMTAVILPSLSSRISSSNSANVTQTLKTLNDAIQKYRENVGYFPSQLTLLTAKPTTSNTNSCGQALSSTDVALWRGPYLSATLTSNGISAGDALILNSLTRVPASTTSSTLMDGELDITVQSSTATLFNDVETAFDATGSTSSTSGLVRYSSTTATITFILPISGC
jgi:prepilin-type N-terminal cleavage/methylation domain-containing protein